MLFIDILDDEELQGILDKMISGLLPHNKFDKVAFSSIMENITKLIKLDEFSDEYYILINILKQFENIALTNENFNLELNSDALNETLQSNLQEVITSDNINASRLLTELGFDSDLSKETTRYKACEIIYSRTVDLYERCMKLEIPSNEVFSYIPAYKEIFLTHVAQQSLLAQNRILLEELKLGKNIYKGSDGWVTFSEMYVSEVSSRIAESDDEVTILDDSSKSDELLDSMSNQYQPLAEYGIPELDDFTPIMKHRLVVIAANENVGKTSVSVHMATKLIIAGKRVGWMCGENTKANVYGKILSNYIYQTRGIFITVQQIAKRHTLPQDMQQLISLCAAKIYSDGSLVFVNTLPYENVDKVLNRYYNEIHFDGFFIDHSGALKGRGNITENIGSLAYGLREFKKSKPVFVCVLSHLSTVAKELLAKDKAVNSSPTAYSSDLSKEADDIFILHKNSELDKRNLITLFNYKRRDASVVVDEIILRKMFNVSAYKYDPTIQVSNTGYSTSAEGVLKMIEDSEEVEDDDLYEYDEQLDDFEDEDIYEEDSIVLTTEELQKLSALENMNDVNLDEIDDEWND